MSKSPLDATVRSSPRPCLACGQDTIFRSPLDKYCRPCAPRKDAARKLAWQQLQPHVSVPLTAEQRQERRIREAARRDAGRAASVEAKQSMFWMAEDGPDLSRICRIAIPFDVALSKNAMWSMARGSNYVFASHKHKQLRASIEGLFVKAVVEQGRFFHGKVWLDILVQKPSHRVDAVNMLDGICDAVKEAIGIDDNWFAIRRLDWQIVKENPMIYIGIGQEILEDHQACSYCGGILPLPMFGARKHGKMGRSTVCLVCCKADDAVRRSRRQSKQKGKVTDGRQ